MATHSSILAWRIPGTGEPGGLLSMGSHRVRLKQLSSSSQWLQTPNFMLFLLIYTSHFMNIGKTWENKTQGEVPREPGTASFLTNSSYKGFSRLVNSYTRTIILMLRVQLTWFCFLKTSFYFVEITAKLYTKRLTVISVTKLWHFLHWLYLLRKMKALEIFL